MRDGINIARYALKLGHTDRGGFEVKKHVRQATAMVLGDEALDYLPGEVPLESP